MNPSDRIPFVVTRHDRGDQRAVLSAFGDNALLFATLWR